MTHQAQDYQEGTARRLREPDLAGVPVLTLVSPRYRLVSRNLLERTDHLLYSHHGEFDPATPLARRVHLFGGYCNQCLRESLVGMISSFQEHSRASKMEAILHVPHVYEKILSKRTLPIAPKMMNEKPPALSEFIDLDFGEPASQRPTSEGQYVNSVQGPAIKYTVQLPDLRTLEIFVVAD